MHYVAGNYFAKMHLFGENGTRMLMKFHEGFQKGKSKTDVKRWRTEHKTGTIRNRKIKTDRFSVVCQGCWKL